MKRIDRELFASTWPEQERVESVSFQPGDVLLVCGGFEDRAMHVLTMAARSAMTGLTVLDVEYSPSVESNHFKQIGELCAGAGWTHLRVEYDRRNPAGIFRDVVGLLPPEMRRLYVDISGMSRLLIVQLLVGLIDEGMGTTMVSVLYTEAESYPPSEAEATTKITNHVWDAAEILSFISVGVYDLAVVPELASLGISRAPTRLVAFPSFNPAQLFSAKSIVQPAKTTLIHGIPPDPNLHWRTNAICQINQVSESSVDEQIKTSTLEYSECLKNLLLLYERWSEFNSIVLSPTGSKMQTVALGIFRAFVHDAQVVYPTPLRFTDPTDHTRGAKHLYKLDLDLFIAMGNNLRITSGA